MDKENPKSKVLKELHPQTYQIYGIFDFRRKQLVYVSLDYEEVELQFELEDYGEDFDIIEFTVIIT